MTLRDKISALQKEALKNRDEDRLSTLRLIWSSVRNEEIAKRTEEGGTLSDDEIQKVIARQIKQLNDALKDFTAGGRADLVEKTNKEITILKEFVPEELGDEELVAIVKKIVVAEKAAGPTNVGKIMGLVMKEVGGRAGGNRVRAIVTKSLES